MTVDHRPIPDSFLQDLRATSLPGDWRYSIVCTTELGYTWVRQVTVKDPGLHSGVYEALVAAEGRMEDARIANAVVHATLPRHTIALHGPTGSPETHFMLWTGEAFTLTVDEESEYPTFDFFVPQRHDARIGGVHTLHQPISHDELRTACLLAKLSHLHQQRLAQSAQASNQAPSTLSTHRTLVKRVEQRLMLACPNVSHQVDDALAARMNEVKRLFRERVESSQLIDMAFQSELYGAIQAC